VSFLDKFKKGVTEAGAKAINTVETNRLKATISKNNGQINMLYTEMGKKIFNEYHNQPSPLFELIENEIKQVQTLFAENKQLEIDIKTIWNTKDCTCGKSVALDAKFCSACGHRFNLVTIPEGTPETEILEITHEPNTSRDTKFQRDHNDSIDSSIICPNCDTEVESDAKFCGDCGQML
jgi:predicted Zn-ribbon and HTH transcriptional regulator